MLSWRQDSQHHLPAQKAEVLLVSGLCSLPHDGLESLAIQSPDVRLGHSWMREIIKIMNKLIQISEIIKVMHSFHLLLEIMNGLLFESSSSMAQRDN